jgi:hypothetical protein
MKNHLEIGCANTTPLIATGKSTVIPVKVPASCFFGQTAPFL